MSDLRTVSPTLPVRALRIGDVTIDLNYRRVERDDASVELPQRPFDLLCLFLAEPRTLHTRKDLFRRIWKGVIVEDSNLTQSVWLLRRALGEPGKDWIRTVAKSGYVFDPPFAIQAIDEAAADAAVNDEEFRPLPADADSAPAAIVEPAPAPAARRRAWRWPAVAAMLLALCVIAAAVHRYAGTAGEPLRVVLIAVDAPDVAEPRVPGWPQQLLREWLEWKLSREPGVAVVTAPQLAGAKQGGRVVLLSVTSSVDDATRLRMHAHLGDAGGSRDVYVDGSLDAMPQAADRVSTDVVNLLLPGSERRYPPVAVDTETARNYVIAIERRAARRPAEAITAFEAAIRQTPAFGLARVQLAELYGELDQVSAAKQQLDLASAWIAALPPEVQRLQQAQGLMLRRDPAAAADAYAWLVERYPRQPQYRLSLAWALTRAQRSNDALAVLDTIDWSTQPLPLRVDALLERAGAQREAGALDDAKRTALQADALAADAGWPLERGRALLVFASASVNDASADKWLAFDRAAMQFELGGDRMNALRAQLGGEALRPVGVNPVADRASNARLSALLGEARTAGNREIEIGALRLVAWRLRRAGDLAAAREGLAEASAVAQASGDLQRDSALQLDLAVATFALGDFAAADRHFAAIDAAGAQGNSQWWKRLFTARIALRRGRLAEADAALGPVPAEGAALPVAAGMLECERADLDMARGDGAAARLAAGRCMRSGLPYDVAAGRIALARLAQDAGDDAQTLQEVEAAEAAIGKLPDVDQWILTTSVAVIRARAGSPQDVARTRLADVVARAAAGKVRVAETDARLGLAELALARRDLDDARLQIEALRQVVPDGDWSGQSRLALIEAARDYAGNDAAQARERLQRLDAQARENGDVALEQGAHELAAAWGDALCPVAPNGQLPARGGVHGLAARWLFTRQPEAPEQERLAGHKPRPPS